MSRTVLISCLAAGQPCPSLLTTAACSGLRPEPDCRPRRTFLHLSYSCASPFGPAILVTHDPNAAIVPPSGPPRLQMIYRAMAGVVIINPSLVRSCILREG